MKQIKRLCEITILKRMNNTLRRKEGIWDRLQGGKEIGKRCTDIILM